jgi:uncharacterized protein YbcI
MIQRTEAELEKNTSTKQQNILIKTFYGTKHLDIASSCSHKINNDTRAGIIVWRNSRRNTGRYLLIINPSLLE